MLSPYKPPIPFPQRFAKAKIEEQFRKFVELLKKLYINIFLTKALSYISSYAKFLKEILSTKRKLVDNETVPLIEECSAIIQNKLPPKLKYPESFSIPCVNGDMSFERALYDLGASVSSCLCQFVRSFMWHSEVPILLGRSFLATKKVVIDVKHGKLVFNVDDEKIKYNLSNLMKSPSLEDYCCKVDLIDHCVKDFPLGPLSQDGLEA
ncbi:uncharacterized protein [Cicer arietinum]|uniref:Uncharacterized protein LOC101491750 n=1 Tax=Cicer arietinum TaxID=3827 RepID=A0A1S2Z4D5_CICAR|nr:uncharacterized protein LOC101491750 [Cicer arietinum]